MSLPKRTLLICCGVWLLAADSFAATPANDNFANRTTLASNLVIEATDSLSAPNWQPISVTPQIEGTNRVISLPNTGTNRFYRLKVN